MVTNVMTVNVQYPKPKNIDRKLIFIIIVVACLYPYDVMCSVSVFVFSFILPSPFGVHTLKILSRLSGVLVVITLYLILFAIIFLFFFLVGHHGACVCSVFATFKNFSYSTFMPIWWTLRIAYSVHCTTAHYYFHYKQWQQNGLRIRSNIA